MKDRLLSGPESPSAETEEFLSRTVPWVGPEPWAWTGPRRMATVVIEAPFAEEGERIEGYAAMRPDPLPVPTWNGSRIENEAVLESLVRRLCGLSRDDAPLVYVGARLWEAWHRPWRKAGRIKRYAPRR